MYAQHSGYKLFARANRSTHQVTLVTKLLAGIVCVAGRFSPFLFDRFLFETLLLLYECVYLLSLSVQLIAGFARFAASIVCWVDQVSKLQSAYLLSFERNHIETLRKRRKTQRTVRLLSYHHSHRAV